jgi:hypothetical protein
MPRSGLLLSLVGVALALAALPDLLDGMASQAVGTATLPRLLERFEPLPRPEQQPQALIAAGLLEQLAESDRAWVPSAEPLPDGGIRYLYKRRPGEPELTIPEIRALMAHPPRHEEERQAIVALLDILQQAGVALQLSEPFKSGAAAEWDHQVRTLRIRPDVVERGTLDFARVLNHEAIHVAQSCAGGGLRSRPVSLGIASTQSAPRGIPPTGGAPPGGVPPVPAPLASPLADPLYAGASEREQAMEREAYAHQNRLGIGRALVAIHCLDGRA